MKYFYKCIKTPAGIFNIVSDSKNIVAAFFGKDKNKLKSLYNSEQKDIALLKKAAKQVKEYFDGSRKSFSLPLFLDGTDFQKKTWKVLQSIPFGSTISYKQQAAKINAPNAYRAVGQTNSRNPICLFIPCHRVISSNGDISGYAGGIRVKKTLINHEKAVFE